MKTSMAKFDVEKYDGVINLNHWWMRMHIGPMKIEGGSFRRKKRKVDDMATKVEGRSLGEEERAS